MPVTLAAELWSWSSFTSELSAGLIALIVGIPVGLSIDRHNRLRSQAEKERGDRLRFIDILTLVQAEMDQNRILLEEVQTAFQPIQAPFFAMSVEIWSAIRPGVLEAFSSADNLAEVSRLYFSFGLFQRSLDALAAASEGSGRERTILLTIEQLTPRLLSALRSADVKISEEIGLLRKSST